MLARQGSRTAGFRSWMMRRRSPSRRPARAGRRGAAGRIGVVAAGGLVSQVLTRIRRPRRGSVTTNAVMAWRLGAGATRAEALHGVFVTGLLICLVAVASAFLVPAGRARDLARADVHGEPTRVGG